MTAISKAWVVIADTAVDPDSPIDATLMTGIRDDLVHVREWLGASYVGGAVQDHNHDGSNSAAISGEVGTIKPWPGLVLPGVIWDWCDGGTLLRTTNAILFGILMKEANVLISNAAPAVVTWNGHGLRTNMPIRFFTTGGLPAGITAGTHGSAGVGTEYFVKVIDGNTFNIAATPGGANINTSSAGSGVHTGTVTPHGDGDGATTFNKPDLRGSKPIGRDDMGGTAANRVTVGNSGIQGNVPGRRGGAETVTLSNAQLPVIGQTVTVNSGTSIINQSGGGTSGLVKGSGTNVVNITASVSGFGGGALHQNMDPSGVYDWIIRIA